MTVFFRTLICYLVPELLVGRCLLLDAMALGGMGVWAARELRARQKNSTVKLTSFQG